MSDRDPWDPPEPDAWMDGGDLWPTPPAAQPLQEDEADLILQAVNSRPWEDPLRYQDGFRILFVAVASIASGYIPGGEQHRATQALRQVMARTLHGEEQAEVNRR